MRQMNRAMASIILVCRFENILAIQYVIGCAPTCHTRVSRVACSPLNIRQHYSKAKTG